MQILVKNSKMEGYDKFYVVAVQATPEGDVTTTLEGGVFSGSSLFTIFEQQVLSWSMTETVTLTLYGEKDGKTYYGATVSASVADLAIAKLAAYTTAGDTTAVRALVDMLNYGAAVQTAYSHNAENLPNANLGEYADKGTTAEPEMTAENDIGEAGSVKVYLNSISMKSKVELQLMVKTSALETAEAKATLNGEKVDVVYNAMNETYTVIKVAVGAANMRDTYTIALYDANGNAVTAVYNVSVEGYAKAQLGGTYNDVVIAMMRYGDSVAAI